MYGGNTVKPRKKRIKTDWPEFKLSRLIHDANF